MKKPAPTPKWDSVLNGADHVPFVPWFLTAAEMYQSEHDTIAKRYGKAEAERLKPLSEKPADVPAVR